MPRFTSLYEYIQGSFRALALQIKAFDKFIFILFVFLVSLNVYNWLANSYCNYELKRCALSGNLAGLKKIGARKRANINKIFANGKSILHEVCILGKLDIVEALLSLGANINEADAEGRTALFHAINGGSVEIIQLLIDKKCPIDGIDFDGNSPALHAAAQHKVEELKVFLKAGCNVNWKNRNGDSLLLIALRSNVDSSTTSKADTVLALLEQKDIAVSVRNRLGMTPLLFALEFGDLRILDKLRTLLGKNLDIKYATAVGWTAMFSACKCNKTTSVEWLLSKYHHSVDVNSIMSDGTTPLLVCAQYGNIEVAKFLLSHGVDISCSNSHKNNVISIAAGHNNKDFVGFILQEIIDRNTTQLFDEVSTDGWSPLGIICQKGYHEYADVILKHCSSVAGQLGVVTTNPPDWTVLMCACNHGSVDLVNLILQAGEDAKASLTIDNDDPLKKLVDFTDDQGWSAVVIAIAKGHQQLVDALLSKNIILSNKINPISRFTSVSNKAFQLLYKFKLLKSKGVPRPCSLVSFALALNNACIAKVLIQHGATADSTTMTLACHKREYAVIKELRKHGVGFRWDHVLYFPSVVFGVLLRLR